MEFRLVLAFRQTVLWLRRLIADLSTWRPGFDPTPMHVRFVVDKVELGPAFPKYFGSVISITFHQCSITHLYPHVAVTNTNRRSNALSEIWEHLIQKYCHLAPKRSDQFWGPSTLVLKGYRASFPGSNAARASCWPLIASNANVN
jgi:hypothetical protein